LRMWANARFHTRGMLTSCRRTVIGLPWSPGIVEGRPALFNLNQLTRIHAVVLEGSMERGDFIERAMGIRDADIPGWVTQALRYLKMQAAAQELVTQSQGDNTRTNRWLSGWVRRNQVRLRVPEPLEGARMDHVTTPVIRRWFREMMAWNGQGCSANG
jgi:hypothetical protein